MNLYENVFVARQDLAPNQVEALSERFSNIIRDNGGQVGKAEYCGVRNLTYLIKKNRRGHYVVMNITAPAAAVKEMERVMGLNEDLLRFMTLRVDEHEKAPSALFKSTRYQREESAPRDGDEMSDGFDGADETDAADETESEE